jgi:hypothetical protein
MRTLSRPMFNMGGPIKQGIMHGIREPYKHGGPTGTGLVGDQRYPKTGGREHHGFFLAAAPWLARMLGTQAVKKVAQKGIGSVAQGEMAKKGIQESIKRAAGAGAGTGTGTATGIAAAAPTGFKGYLMRDPMVKAALWAKNALMSPTSKGWGKSALRFATAPSSLAVGAYMGGKKLFGGDDAADVVTGIEKPGGYPKADEKKIKKAQDAFAEAQRNTRVQKYLDMMGYDRSKKTAVADALIDASKIVSDRGTLETKNITRDLISPIIQATSKRFDKPEQIREAVGLMTTKAAIEKDLEDPSIKALRLEQLKGLRGGFSKDIGDFVLSAKGQKIKPEALKRYARAKADQHGLDFTVVTDEMIAQAGPDATEDQKIQAVVSGDGVYMIGDALIQVTDGIPKQIA